MKYTGRNTAGRANYVVVPVVHYQANGTVYRGLVDGSSECVPVSCDHKHATPEAAEKCGERVAARMVRKFNAEAAQDQ